MIEYFKIIFNKPQYQLTGVEKIATAGLIVGLVIIVSIICVGIWLIVCKIAENKHYRCSNCRYDKYQCSHQKCIGCKDYKKKPNKSKDR